MTDKLTQIQELLGFRNAPAEGREVARESIPPEALAATPDAVPLDPELDEEFERYFTQHTFASHPLSKLALVSLGSGLVVAFLVACYSLVQAPQESAATAPPPKGEEPDELFAESKQAAELDELKARLALSEQERAIQSRQRQEQPVAAAKPEAEVKPPGRVETPLKGAAKTAPRRTATAPRPAPPAIRQVVRVPPPDAVRPAVTRSLAKSPAVDAEARWKELSELGSFKAAAGSAPAPLAPVEPLKADLKLSAAAPFPAPSRSAMLAVQKVRALVEGGIAVPAGLSVSGEAPLVSLVLIEPLLDSQGREIVPEGARLLATVTLQGRILTLTPEQLAFEGAGGEYVEADIDGSTVTITGSGGPLVAGVRNVGEDGGGLSASQLGQLAGALGGLADIEGATEFSLILNALGGGNPRSYARSSVAQIYTLDDRTETMVRIARPLSISLPAATSEAAGAGFDFDY